MAFKCILLLWNCAFLFLGILFLLKNMDPLFSTSIRIFLTLTGLCLALNLLGLLYYLVSGYRRNQQRALQRKQARKTDPQIQEKQSPSQVESRTLTIPIQR
jgi:hypothetical protein